MQFNTYFCKYFYVMKTGIENDVLEVAREEFFEKGFKDASMRNIAKKADITLSNIYYYYKNKDDLFLKVVKPIKDILDSMFGMWVDIDSTDVSIEAYTNPQYQKQSIETLVKLMLEYKKDVHLFLFNSQGSTIEHIDKTYIDSATQSNMAYMKKISEKYPELNITVSELFIRTMSAHIFTIIGEIVSKKLNTDELECFVTDLVAFNTQGWKGIIYKNNEKKKE